MFLPFICLSAVNIGFGGSGHPRALLAVVLWLGGLFYGGMSLLCRCLRALCVVSLVSVILSLSGGRRFCVCCVRRFLRFVRLFFTAVCVFQHFCADRFFLSLVCFFCANFSLLLMSVFIFFSAVECCLLCFVFFRHFRIINWGFPRLDGLFYVICLSLPLITHFFCFF